jgi:hypothetical protein
MIEFGSALSKLQNFGRCLNPLNPPLGTSLVAFVVVIGVVVLMLAVVVVVVVVVLVVYWY